MIQTYHLTIHDIKSKEVKNRKEKENEEFSVQLICCQIVTQVLKTYLKEDKLVNY